MHMRTHPLTLVPPSQDILSERGRLGEGHEQGTGCVGHRVLHGSGLRLLYSFPCFCVFMYDVLWWTMRLWGYIHLSEELWWTIMQVIDAMIGMNFRELRPGFLSPAQFILYSSVMEH